MNTDKNNPASYAAVAMQLTAHSVEKCNSDEEASAIIDHAIDGLAEKLRATQVFVNQYTGLPVKMAVLPEYYFTSYPVAIPIPDFARRAGFAMDGAEYEKLGAMCQKLGMYLAGNTYEVDPHFPDMYFQTCFIVAPSGDIILRYRRLISMFAPTPHDVWDKYLDIYGIEAIFPVARTEIGNLACIASEEILYPEIARAHAMNGAEVFLHPSSEIGSPLATQKAVARRARAFENMAYVVSANTAGISGAALPADSANGNSQFLDYKGHVVTEANTGETMTAHGEVNLASLRAARRRPAMTNTLARQANELFASSYAEKTARSANGLTNIKDGKIDRSYFVDAQKAAIERLIQDDVI